MIRSMLNRWNRHQYVRKWRAKNKHNETYTINSFNMDYVQVGNYTYGGLYVLNFNTTERLKIGHYCSIGPRVSFILNADHRMDTISSFPYKVKCLHSTEYEGISKGDILIDDDVWIGCGATILSGVHIGQGAVIAAGAVVATDIPPYAIAGGVPAKIIRYRFDKELCQELLQIDYSKLTKELVEKNLEKLYCILEDKKQLDWFPKR